MKRLINYKAMCVASMMCFASFGSNAVLAGAPSWEAAKCIKSVEVTPRGGSADSVQSSGLDILLTFTDNDESKFFTAEGVGSGYLYHTLNEFQIATILKTIEMALENNRQVQVWGNTYYNWALGLRITDGVC